VALLKRREALANAITAKDNYWFAAAHVNRVWGHLMGQSFYQPVDHTGPKKEVVFASVLTRPVLLSSLVPTTQMKTTNDDSSLRRLAP
jgi:hypothetical protein